MTDIEFIHNLAIQYFNGTISLDDEKILFEYVNSDDNAKYNFRVWEKNGNLLFWILLIQILFGKTLMLKLE